MSMLSSYRMEHLRLRPVLRGEPSGRGVAAVIDGQAAVADGAVDGRGAAGDSGRAENSANLVEQIKQLIAEHDRNLAGSNLVRAKEVVRLGWLISACLEAGPHLKKKDLAGQLGKDRSWVTRFTRAARLAVDPERITADQAAVILQTAHGNVRRAATQGRICTLQSLTARILRAYQDAARYWISAGELEASVKAKLAAGGFAGVASDATNVGSRAAGVHPTEPGGLALSAVYG